MSAQPNTVATVTPDFSRLETAGQVADFFANLGVQVEKAADVLSDGFELIEDKGTLVKTPMALLSWSFSESKEYGGEYVVVRAITRDNRRIRFVDGSTGIRKQLRDLTDKRVNESHPYPTGALLCGGLRVSEYDYTNDKGKTAKARTYYISE